MASGLFLEAATLTESLLAPSVDGIGKCAGETPASESPCTTSQGRVELFNQGEERLPSKSERFRVCKLGSNPS